MYCIQDNNTAVLISQFVRSQIELLRIFCRPPIFQISIFIILTTLIIKPMSHFMPDYNAYTSIIYSIIGIHIKERRLQDTGRETDFVRSRVIISVYCLRTHQPTGFIDRFIYIAQHIIRLEYSSFSNIIPI